MQWLLPTCLLALALVPAGEARTSDAPARCRPAHTRTVADNGRVRVYATNSYDEYFGCSYRSGRRIAMGYESGSSSGDFTVGPIRLARDTVAWQEREGHDYVEGYWENALYVRNARTAKRLHAIELKRGASVTAVVVKPDGAVAWLSVRDVTPEGAAEPVFEYRLNRYDLGGLEQLDRGTGDAAPRSLRRNGSRIEWMRRGVARTARLR
jgi:hypothetical protein